MANSLQDFRWYYKLIPNHSQSCLPVLMMKTISTGIIFLENVMKYFDIFQEAHTEVPGYSDPLEDNYQWDWETFLNMLGL